MLNEEATALSHSVIPAQLDNIKQSFPFMRKLHLTDASNDSKMAVDVKMDYYGGIDVYGKDLEGGNYNIQFKARKPEHEDLIFTARKITDSDVMRNPNIGFMWNGEKYTFLTGSVDIISEYVGGNFYNIRSTDLMAMEQSYDSVNCPYINAIYPQERYKADGSKFWTGDYHVFISPVTMMKFKEKLFLNENADYYYEKTKRD